MEVTLGKLRLPDSLHLNLYTLPSLFESFFAIKSFDVTEQLSGAPEKGNLVAVGSLSLSNVCAVEKFVDLLL